MSWSTPATDFFDKELQIHANKHHFQPYLTFILAATTLRLQKNSTFGPATHCPEVSRQVLQLDRALRALSLLYGLRGRIRNGIKLKKRSDMHTAKRCKIQRKAAAKSIGQRCHYFESPTASEEAMQVKNWRKSRETRRLWPVVKLSIAL